MSFWSDEERLAKTYIGMDRWDLADRIAFNIKHRGCGSDLEILAMQLRLTIDFGLAHGWKFTRKRFGPCALVEGKMYSKNDGHYHLFDCGVSYENPCFYRFPNRKPAAVVVNAWHKLRIVDPEEIDERFDIAFPTDWPGWWNPEECQLAVMKRRVCASSNPAPAEDDPLA